MVEVFIEIQKQKKITRCNEIQTTGEHANIIIIGSGEIRITAILSISISGGYDMDTCDKPFLKYKSKSDENNKCRRHSKYRQIRNIRVHCIDG